MTFEEFVSILRAHGCEPRLSGDRQCSALCPGHEDENPSLSAAAGDKGGIVVNCHAGCEPDAVMAALGRTMADLAPQTAPPVQRGKRQRASETRFEIRDAKGEIQAVKLRVDYVGGGKDCYWHRPDGKRGLGPRKTASLPLYGTERLADVPERSLVFLVEGEKKRDALEAAGFSAVGTVTGANGTPDPDVLRLLLPFDVVCWADADDAGHRHMRRNGSSIVRMGGKARFLTWGTMGSGDDAADFLASGGTREQLEAMTRDATPCEATAPAESSRADLVCLADVESREVPYLWPTYVPVGRLTMLDGDPGSGKSWLAIAMSATLSTGGKMPEEDGIGREPVSILYVGAEDDPSDTLRPRFETAGADLTRVHVLRGKRDDAGHVVSLSLADLDIFAEVVRRTGARLLIIDPIQAYMPPGASMNAATDVRPLLAALARLAEELDIAVLVIRHLRKSGSSRAIYAGMGSMDFVAAARSVLLVGRDPDREGVRIMAHAKCSTGPEGPSLAFEIKDGQFLWIGRSDLRACDLTRDPEQRTESATDEAEAFLREELAGEAVAVTELKRRAKEAGLAWRTVERAKRKLDVIARRKGGIGPAGFWAWELPRERKGGTDE